MALRPNESEPSSLDGEDGVKIDLSEVVDVVLRSLDSLTCCKQRRLATHLIFTRSPREHFKAGDGVGEGYRQRRRAIERSHGGETTRQQVQV